MLVRKDWCGSWRVVYSGGALSGDDPDRFREGKINVDLDIFLVKRGAVPADP